MTAWTNRKFLSHLNYNNLSVFDMNIMNGASGVSTAWLVLYISQNFSDTNDVQKAISLRTQFFDPKGYGLVVVTVEPQTGEVFW